MGYEKRSVRPFETLDRSQKLLNQFVRVQCPPIPDGMSASFGNGALTPIGVNEGAIAAPGGTLVLRKEHYVGEAIGLYFGVNEADWEELVTEMGHEIDAIFGRRGEVPVSVMVTLTNSRLKQVEILSVTPFDEWASGGWRHVIAKRVKGEGRPRALRMPADGCALGIRFVLHNDLPVDRRLPARPWRKGSWLAKVEIDISSAKGGGLLPRPMNDSIRSRFGLAAHTSLYVDFRGSTSGLHAATDLADVITVYIDEELLMGALEENAKGEPLRAAGGPLVNRWVLDTYRTLIEMLSRDDRLDEFDPDDPAHQRTFLYSMLSNVEGECGIAMDEALLILKDQPNRFAALYEHVLHLKQHDQRLLGLKG